MSEPKHTPGPWIVVNDTLVRDSHGMAIAATKWSTHPSAPEYAANARLVASAPDLSNRVATLERQLTEMEAVAKAAADVAENFKRYESEQRARVRELEEALETLIQENAEATDHDGTDETCPVCSAIRAARAALARKE